MFNVRTKEVTRLDGIEQACRRLPDDHGIFFPGGYYLDTGAAKTFDTEVAGLEYERVVRSPNGEDVLYVFHSREDGRSLLLPYNVIRKRVATPVTCHGYSLFEDGTLVVMRAFSDEPTRVHPMQIWATRTFRTRTPPRSPSAPGRWSASGTPTWCAESPNACRSPGWWTRCRRPPGCSRR